MINNVISYELHFRYYQYNSGLADNGNYSRKIEYKTLEEAKQDAEKINFALNNPEDDKSDEIMMDFLPNPGHFLNKPEIREISRRSIEY